MGCSSCKEAQSYEKAKDLALKITQVWQSDVIIFKQFIHGIGYTYGYQRADEPVSKRCEQVEVIRFSQHQSSEILSDNSGEQSSIIKQEGIRHKPTKRKSSSTVIEPAGGDSGTV